MKLTNLVFILILLITGCKDDKCLKKTGRQIKISRNISDFEVIYLYDDINLIITDSIKEGLMVEGGENLLSFISTDVSDKILTILNNNTCNWLRDYSTPVNVYLNLPQASKIFYYGFGGINNRGTLKLKNLNLHHYGQGNVDLTLNVDYFWCAADNFGLLNLSGVCKQLVIGSYKTGRVDTRMLAAKNAEVLIKGSADNYIRCDSILNVEFASSANLYLIGNPRINKSGGGKGTIQKF